MKERKERKRGKVTYMWHSPPQRTIFSASLLIILELMKGYIYNKKRDVNKYNEK
jgi:hypothetical protein